MTNSVSALPDGTPIPRALRGNPFFHFVDQPQMAPAWDAIRPEHVRPAFEFAFQLAARKIEAVRARAQADIDNGNINTATYKNTIQALETSDELLGFFFTTMYNINPATARDRKAFDRLGDEMVLRYMALYETIFVDPALYQAVRNVGVRPSELNREQAHLREMYENGFCERIINGSPETRAEFADVSRKITELEMKLSHRMRAAAEETLVVVDDPDRLSGISPILVDAARKRASRNGLAGRWAFSMDRTLFKAVMSSADDRKLRKDYWDAFYSQGSTPPYDNREMILDLVRLRHRHARLQGERSHAHDTIQYQMAVTPANVANFLEDIRRSTVPVARKELKKITQFMRDTTSYTKLNPWDVEYYKSQLQKSELGYDDEDLRPYFEFNTVMAGITRHFEKLYPGIKIEQTDEYAAYHPDQLAYNVINKRTGKVMGVQFMDPFARDNKPSGVAWSGRVRGRGLFMGQVEGAINAIVTKYTKGEEGEPTLLTHYDVEVAMHEWGHGMHEIISQCKSQALSGFGVAHDWVEFPSQIQENWAYQPEFIRSIARHVETGEPMPEEWIEKLSTARGYMNALLTLETTMKGALDLAWAKAHPDRITSVEEFERAALAKFEVMDRGKAMYTPWFDYIFSGGYSAGFYAYQWAQVHEADAFALYQRKGDPYDKGVNRRLKHMMELGGSVVASKLFLNFRHRAADPAYFKMREGLDASRGVGVDGGDAELTFVSGLAARASPRGIMRPWLLSRHP